jgi:hypothetical protein
VIKAKGRKQACALTNIGEDPRSGTGSAMWLKAITTHAPTLFENKA